MYPFKRAQYSYPVLSLSLSCFDRASLVAQLVKKLPVTAGDLGSIPDWDIPLEKGEATHSSVLAWRIPWTV